MHPGLRPVLLTLAASAGAQTPTRAELLELTRDLLVPIHSQPDDPVGGRYGLWAAGPDYKVSFHDGFAFYPCLGPQAPRHLPLHWRTESIRVGEHAIPLDAAAETHSDHRFERRTGDWIEAYDVRRDGVEQTFTLLRKPEVAGDLVITGAITTPLVVPVADPAHQDLELTEDGQPVVRYGRAFTVDAAGRRTKVANAADGARIRIVVPASVLAQAVYPLVVDPLTSSVSRQYTGSFPGIPSITAQTTTSAPKLVFAWVRAVTAADSDVYALVTSFDQQSGSWLYQDVTASWSTEAVDSTWVGGASRWVLGLQRKFGTINQVRVYMHDGANTTMNSGTTLFPAAPTGLEQRRPAVGGSLAGSLALLVFERRDPVSGLSGVWGIRVDPAAATMQTPFGFGGGLLESLLSPAVTPLASGNTGWVVVMIGNGVRIGHVPHNGSGTVATRVLTTPSAPVELLSTPGPCIAGADGRYLVAYVAQDYWSAYYHDEVHAVRFDWPSAAATPTILRHTIVERASHYESDPEVDIGGCAFDHVTRSHWALVTGGDASETIRRFGASGGITERQSLPDLADVAFARPALRSTFPIAYSNPSATGMYLHGREFIYPPDAISVAYGSSCGPGVSVSANACYAGHEFFRVTASGLPASSSAFYLLSTTTGALELGAAGMPGCWLNIGLPWLVCLPVAANASGQASISYPLGDVPLFTGDLFSQWLWYDPAAAPAPFRTSGGLRHQVR